MPTQISTRYWLIRHPASDDPKKTVAQFDIQGGTQIPDEIAGYDDFEIQEISGSSELVGTVDQSGLNDEEKQLLSDIYPVQS